MNASIITIGDELLIGQTIDTNSAFIGQELNKIGIWVRRRVAVGDVWEDIVNALDEESRISKLIILTGGLGPTADDITKPLLAEYFGGKLVVDENVLAHVKYLFEKVYRRPGPILERNLKQAEVPDVATVLHNTWGSAPGMLFKKNDTVFISLPGVPHEMKGLMSEQVIPYLLKNMVLQAIVHRTAFTFGQGESMIAEKLIDFEATLPAHIKLAYLPGYGMVKLRLTSKGADKDLVEKELLPYFEELKTRVSEFLVSDEDEPLEVVIGKILSARNQTMATAESCTGGYIAHLITSVAGSSTYYKGSVISYANEVKQDILHVKEETLRQFGAVSQQTVTEMAEAALLELKTDYALATSGIMGPGGGSEEKPVGTVWIAVAGRGKVLTHKLNLRFDRQRNIMMATANALNLLRKFILTNT
ncbi:MAG: competence/damage-inducible protein A [Chitinophagaceae bacterium]|nr:competence/damage-inducible protein A [Chitinophagaceae bacterium]